MRTSKYTNDLISIIDNEFDEYAIHQYDFFTYETNGKPNQNLIFLNYIDFDIVVNEFFNNLYNYLINSGRYNNIKVFVLFKLCVIEMFTKTSLSKGSLFKKIKYKYKFVKSINENEFEALIIEISDIKMHYKNKYIPLYEKIRNNLAKDLIKENNIYICPYCKRNYINIITSKNETDFIIKPDLDHFYDKARYIFLAATIDNLIPSCTVCNGKLKGSIDFYKNKHRHPLVEENVIDTVTFNYIGSDNTIFIEEKNLLKNTDKISFNSLSTFRIEEVYNTHKEILFNIKNKYHHYNKVKRKNISNMLPSLNNREILRTVFYEYFHLDKNKEPMYKMKKDLFDKIVK